MERDNEDLDLDDEREMLARVCNCLLVLARKFVMIGDVTIRSAFDASTGYATKELLKPEIMDKIAGHVRTVLAETH